MSSIHLLTPYYMLCPLPRLASPGHKLHVAPAPDDPGPMLHVMPSSEQLEQIPWVLHLLLEDGGEGGTDYSHVGATCSIGSGAGIVCSMCPGPCLRTDLTHHMWYVSHLKTQGQQQRMMIFYTHIQVPYTCNSSLEMDRI